jgi:hypothetical protein
MGLSASTRLARLGQEKIPGKTGLWNPTLARVGHPASYFAGIKSNLPDDSSLEKRSLFGIAPAPMLLSTGNSQETAGPHTLVAGFILVQIGALHNKLSKHR